MVSFLLTGTYRLIIPINTTLDIYNFNFFSYKVENVIFDYFLNVSGEISLYSCNFHDIYSYNTVIISYNSILFSQVTLYNISTSIGFIQGFENNEKQGIFYTFNNFTAENINVQIPLYGTLLTCDLCSINVNKSDFR